jgi:hypothetical protein
VKENHSVSGFLNASSSQVKPNVLNYAKPITRQHQETIKIKTNLKFNSRARPTVLSRTYPLKYPSFKPKFRPQKFLVVKWNSELSTVCWFLSFFQHAPTISFCSLEICPKSRPSPTTGKLNAEIRYTHSVTHAVVAYEKYHCFLNLKTVHLLQVFVQTTRSVLISICRNLNIQINYNPAIYSSRLFNPFFFWKTVRNPRPQSHAIAVLTYVVLFCGTLLFKSDNKINKSCECPIRDKYIE